MKHIPSEKDLDQKVKLVQIKVTGEYIARIDDKRNTSKHYEIDVLVPERFTLSDVKRQTPKALQSSKDFTDFVFMREFHVADGNPKKTEKTATRRSLMTPRELVRIQKLRREALEDQKKEAARRGIRTDAGVSLQDDTNYDPKTGLPPLVEPELHGDGDDE